MEVIRGFEKLPTFSNNTAVTIGNFDGVHIGHQRILKFLIDETNRNDLHSLVLTFSPHPDKILGNDKIKLIQTLDQRIESIENIGVHYIVITPFTSEFYSLSSLNFIQKILIETLNAKEVVIGENFRFGKDRKGDISSLNSLGKRYSLGVHEVLSVTLNGSIVSSSLIRDLLTEGKIKEANSLLGKKYEIKGQVIEGKKRGKKLGFPTANIKTENEIIPPGVYITETKIDNKIYASMTNIGYRPTFGPDELQVESYIINFSQNLYKKELRIYFIKKTRSEKKFTSPRALSAQLQKDLEITKAYFCNSKK